MFKQNLSFLLMFRESYGRQKIVKQVKRKTIKRKQFGEKLTRTDKNRSLRGIKGYEGHDCLQRTTLFKVLLVTNSHYRSCIHRLTNSSLSKDNSNVHLLRASEKGGFQRHSRRLSLFRPIFVRVVIGFHSPC